ncbi:EIICB-Glc [Actinomyces bovis]|uniref:EIICB-Glc n=1 Tax=Actinomyces bovis TaxID=1658 RepID=A0ABY1VMK7_9ACTO|nr:PTS transporter subunit EIIB [Actinomyces bovis]SPT52707.1 EIICB-Glc [Actinomyces bovis]VEG54658.1 EIICB-Glc [Actinomyces israelii]
MKPDVRAIVAALGGAENIDSLEPCTTRLRVEVLEPSRVDRTALRRAGTHGVSVIGRVAQVIVGPNADLLSTDIAELLAPPQHSKQ